MGKPVVYIASDYMDFLQYQKENPESECIHITDVSTLGGRAAGEIVEMNSLKSLWNWVGISESIDRFKNTHKKFYEVKEEKKDIDLLDLDEDDLELGV
jgi:hypothetical protein